MPNALQIMSLAAKDAGISVTGTYAELQKLQEQGKVVSSKVLPFFAKRMSEAAQANGGLNKALESNRVAMNRMTTSAQESSDSFFKSGYSEGLTDLFNTLATSLKENSKLWKSLGKIVGSLLKGLSKLIDFLSAVLQRLGDILKPLTDTFGDFSGAFALAFMPSVWVGAATLVKSLTTGFITWNLSIKGVTLSLIKMWRALAPILLAVGAADELFNMFFGERQGILPNSVERQKRMEEIEKHWKNPANRAKDAALQQRSSMMTSTFGAPIYVRTTVDVDGETLAEKMVETNTLNNKINDAQSMVAQ